MILFREKHDEANVIHLIMGNETDFQFSMAGHIVADITDNIDPNKRNVIFINRCDSEEELQEQLAYYQERWGNLVKQGKVDVSGVTNINNSNKNQRKSKSKINNLKNEYGIFDKDLKCPDCLCDGTRVRDGVVEICDTCRKIKNGLSKNEIPPGPTDEQKPNIVKDFFRRKTQGNSENGGAANV